MGWEASQRAPLRTLLDLLSLAAATQTEADRMRELNPGRADNLMISSERSQLLSTGTRNANL